MQKCKKCQTKSFEVLLKNPYFQSCDIICQKNYCIELLYFISEKDQW